jgi:hypothetical protein
MGVHFMGGHLISYRRAPHGRASHGVYPWVGIFMGVHLMGGHLIGVCLMWDHSDSNIS